MSIRAHLVDRSEPLREGDSIRANCGVEVANAKFLFYWDEQAMGDQPDLANYALQTRLCRKCADLEIEHRYIYAVANAQELGGRGMRWHIKKPRFYVIAHKHFDAFIFGAPLPGQMWAWAVYARQSQDAGVALSLRNARVSAGRAIQRILAECEERR